MDVGGLEPPTSALSELRSNQLIYTSPRCFRGSETGGAFCQPTMRLSSPATSFSQLIQEYTPAARGHWQTLLVRQFVMRIAEPVGYRCQRLSGLSKSSTMVENSGSTWLTKVRSGVAVDLANMIEAVCRLVSRSECETGFLIAVVYLSQLERTS